tara:strand:+ start:3249 stop:3482 length:234 start_codon:yes stop_codon:yes gene_type:complete
VEQTALWSIVLENERVAARRRLAIEAVPEYSHTIHGCHGPNGGYNPTPEEIEARRAARMAKQAADRAAKEARKRKRN